MEDQKWEEILEGTREYTKLMDYPLEGKAVIELLVRTAYLEGQLKVYRDTDEDDGDEGNESPTDVPKPFVEAFR